jgi:hypothetical protein
LNEPQRINVEQYLIRKWKLVDPPPPPPAPFVPTDISGLYLWMDAANAGSFSLSGSNITSWSNLGLAGASFDAGCNTASRTTDKDGYSWVDMPSQTTLEGYMAFPYYSRTAFVAFKNTTPLDTITYPYENLMSTDVGSGRQLGLAYDSNTSNYSMALCQQGQNCPAAGTIPVVGTGDINLAIWGVLSNTASSNTCYWNGGSNVNTSTDIGNLFNTNPIPYYIGSPVTDSPSFSLGEILEYDTLLSPSQISTVANYLVTKWAISSFTSIV